MIKYQYAFNASTELLHISEINKENNTNKEKYFCIGCNEELTAKLGKVRKHHFAHKVEMACNGETYLHLLAKKLFYIEYQKCLQENIPFHFEYYWRKICDCYKPTLNISCSLGFVTEKFDLTKRFTKISLEKREGQFIPDLILKNESGDEKIFIEIAVSHFSSEEKISSQNRIIEIEIEHEADLEIIKQHYLPINNKQLKFYNFKVKDYFGNYCVNSCQKKLDLFVVYKKGSCIILKRSLGEIDKFIKGKNEEIIHHEITLPIGEYINKFQCLVANAYNKGVAIRNCYLCRYHAENDSWSYNNNYNDGREAIFCKYLKIKCKSTYAVECFYYRADKKIIENVASDESFYLKYPKGNNDKGEPCNLVDDESEEEFVIGFNSFNDLEDDDFDDDDIFKELTK